MCLEAWPLKSYSHGTAGITNQELNTPKSEQFLYKEIPPFTQDLAQVTSEMESCTNTEQNISQINWHRKIFRVRHAKRRFQSNLTGK